MSCCRSANSTRPGLPAGLQPADAQDQRDLGEARQRLPHARQAGTAPPDPGGGGSPQAAQPRDGRADHLCHHRARDAQILRHPADRGPAPLADLRRGHVAVGDAHLRLAGR